jgi:putative ABC transport system substrate-binding protein
MILGRGEHMKRRKFITLLGGAAAWPVVARTEQRSVQVIGLLTSQPSPAIAEFLPAFREALAQTGFVEGRNLAIVYRSAEGEFGRLPELAGELASLQVAVIVAIGGPSSVLAANAATGVIPIVFTSNADPVETGMVASLNRPGGNVTGATGLGLMLAPKQLGLLRDTVPKLTKIGLLLSVANSRSQLVKSEVQTTAQSVGVKMVDAEVGTELDIDTAFARFVEQRVDAVLGGTGAEFISWRHRVIALAAQHRVPIAMGFRQFAVDGGLMSYGADLKDVYRQAGIYVGRILKGAKPVDLPVVQSTKFELAINLKTAKALGLSIPPNVLALADEVIE